MKPIHSFLPVLLLVLSVCDVLPAPPPPINDLAPSVALSLSLPAYVLGDEPAPSGSPSDGFLSEAQLRLVVRASEGRARFPSTSQPWMRAPQEERSESSVEQAERINAEAMRRYREQWEEFRKASPASPIPVLYHEIR